MGCRSERTVLCVRWLPVRGDNRQRARSPLAEVFGPARVLLAPAGTLLPGPHDGIVGQVGRDRLGLADVVRDGGSELLSCVRPVVFGPRAGGRLQCTFPAATNTTAPAVRRPAAAAWSNSCCHRSAVEGTCRRAQ